MSNIFLCGEAGSGKDSVAACLPYHVRLAFGDEVRGLAHDLRSNGVGSAFLQAVKMLGGAENVPKGMLKRLTEMAMIPATKKDRELLQELGIYLKSIDNTVWIKATLRKLQPGISHIITDVRYKDEFQVLKQLGFVAVFVDATRATRVARLSMRDGGHNPASESHAAEAQIAGLRGDCDFVIENNGTLADLQWQVNAVAKTIRRVAEENGQV